MYLLDAHRPCPKKHRQELNGTGIRWSRLNLLFQRSAYALLLTSLLAFVLLRGDHELGVEITNRSFLKDSRIRLGLITCLSNHGRLYGNSSSTMTDQTTVMARDSSDSSKPIELDIGDASNQDKDDRVEMETLRPSENDQTVDGPGPGLGLGSELKNGQGDEGISVPIQEEKEDVIPDGGYGWVNVRCIVAQNSVTWGEYNCIFNHAGTCDRVIGP